MVDRMLSVLEKHRGRTILGMGLVSLALYALALGRPDGSPDWLRPILAHIPDWLRPILLGIAEGILAAIVIAIIVEPALLRGMLDRTRGDVLWALFNQHAPPSWKDTLEGWARNKHYLNLSTWKVEFSWLEEDPKILQLDITTTVHGKTHDKKGYSPSTKLWVLDSCAGYTSRINRYTNNSSTPGLVSGSRLCPCAASGRRSGASD